MWALDIWNLNDEKDSVLGRFRERAFCAEAFTEVKGLWKEYIWLEEQEDIIVIKL